MKVGLRDIVFVSFLIGMLTATYVVVVAPHARMRQQQLAAIRSMNAQLSQVRDSTTDLEQCALHVDRQRQAIATFRSKLAPESEAKNVLDDVQKMTVAHSLTAGPVLLLSPRQLEGDIGEQSADLLLTGNFGGLYSFLLQLELMSPRTQVLQLHLKNVDDASGQIQVELRLAVYFQNGIGEQSVAQSELGDIGTGSGR